MGARSRVGRGPAGTPADATEADDFSTASTAAESSPLLQSDAESSRTLRDASPERAPGRQAAGANDGTDAAAPSPDIGFNRVMCILLSMWTLIFLQASNMSGMTMTQSVIAEDLNAYKDAMWFTSSYLISAASLSPVVSRLSTIFTPGFMIFVSSLFFAVGAVVTSQAHSFSTFIAGRVLVGVGGAGVMTLSLILVLQLTSRRRRGVFVGLVDAGFTIGLSTGAVVYGALLPAIGWRVLFGAQAPIAILAGIGVYLSIPHYATETEANKGKTVLQKLASIDYAGAFFLTLTLVLFLYSLSGDIQYVPMGFSAVTLVIFLAIERLLASDPIIPIRMLKSRGVLLSCLAQMGFMAARWTILYYSPIFVLAVRGLSPAIAGSVLIPTNAGFGSGGLVVGWFHVRRAGSFWLPSIVALVLFAGALLAVSFVSTATAPAWIYIIAVFANGFCTGSLLNYTLAHLLHLTRPAEHFIATGLLATFRGFAGSFGTAIGGGIFGRTLAASLAAGFKELDDGQPGANPDRSRLITRLVGSPALVFSGGLSDAERAVAVNGYENALAVLYHAAVLLSLVCVVVQAGTGWTAPGTEDEEEVEEAIREADGEWEA